MAESATTVAQTLVGGLSKPSKMPCPSYSLPAKNCAVGAVLRQKAGSVCHGCYAFKGFYTMPAVRAALQRRLASLQDPRWVDAMVATIAHTKTRWFRWHDSGDLQSVEHLEKIFEVARRLPDVRFWLPTREAAIVSGTLRLSVCPSNLTIRVSAAMIDGIPPKRFACTSTVVSSGETCPAKQQGNKCLDCRTCWDPAVKNVSYIKH